MSQIRDHIEIVQDRINRAALKAGTDASSIRLVAVSKTKPIEMVEEAIEAGMTEFGENRVQEARQKYDHIDHEVAWHLIGPLQTNKAKHAVHIFDMIQSIDRLSLAEELQKRLTPLQKDLAILIQVKTSDEESKSGIEPERALDLIEQIRAFPNLSIQGLMTIPAYSKNPDDARPSFNTLRLLQEKTASYQFPDVSMDILSMGMTNDFEVAIEEGANMVRVGTAIFGARSKH
jgi:PLP dependent protein